MFSWSYSKFQYSAKMYHLFYITETTPDVDFNPHFLFFYLAIGVIEVFQKKTGKTPLAFRKQFTSN